MAAFDFDMVLYTNTAQGLMTQMNNFIRAIRSSAQFAFPGFPATW
jgi:hypothetical protein